MRRRGSSWTSSSLGERTPPDVPGQRPRRRALSPLAARRVRRDRRLALAGWYQGARAVREVGLYNETKVFVRLVLALYGTV
jgi:hypothetical protein